MPSVDIAIDCHHTYRWNKQISFEKELLLYDAIHEFAYSLVVIGNQPMNIDVKSILNFHEMQKKKKKNQFILCRWYR